MSANSINFARERARRNGESRCSRVSTRAKFDILHAPSGTPFEEVKSIVMRRNDLEQMRTKPLVQNSQPARALVGIDRVRLQIFQVAKRETRFMRRRQNDLWCMTGIERLLPPRCAQAPLVAGLQAGKAELQVGSRKIVSCCLGKRQELSRQDDANRVRPDVLWARIAAAVAVKAGNRPFAARLQRTAEHVLGYFVAIPFHVI